MLGVRIGAERGRSRRCHVEDRSIGSRTRGRLCILAVAGLVGAALAGCMGADMGSAGDYEVEQLGRAYWSATPGPDTVPGVDVSYYQGTIDWNAAAGDGIKFAFIRVSDGDPATVGFADPKFDENWVNAKAAGIIVGAYQFFRPNQDPVAQADYLIAKLGGAVNPGELAPEIDVETDGGLSDSQVVAAIGQWVSRVETQLGVSPIIYTSAYLWSQYTGNSSAFASYPLWVAHYTSPSGPFFVPDAWSDWRFWQYSSSGSVAGIGGNVDMDLFNGTLAALQAFTVGNPTCGDGYCTGGETHATCPVDCPVCENIPPLGRVVDERDLCFEEGGDSRWWRYVEDDGYESTLQWTHTVATAAEMDNYGIWHLTFDQAGQYQVAAYTDASYAQSTQARYQVRHAGVEETQVVDQTAVDGWVQVGAYDFAAGGDQWVRLEDYTGEPLNTNTQIVFDAVRLTRLDPPPEDGGVPGDSGVGPDGGTGSDAKVGVDAGDATPTEDGGVEPDAGTPAMGRGGCSCHVESRGMPGAIPLWAACLAFGWAWRRRRRRPRASEGAAS